jgi:hypothetical protein
MNTNNISSVPFALIAVFTMFLVRPDIASAFEIDTHATLTQQAYRRSTLHNNRDKLSSLGLTYSRIVRSESDKRSNAEIPLGKTYYDFSTNPPTQRNAHRFDTFYSEKKNRWEPIITYKGDTAPFLADWLSRGSVREDDGAVPLGFNPKDAPLSQINRFCRHFFDPLKTVDAGLTNAPGSLGRIGCDSTMPDAVQWALGTSGTGGTGAEDTGRVNRFTVLDAREAQWRAMTGRDKNMQTRPEAQTRAGRDAYWATTFRALGDVMHLLQDMGNPQHTRNEAHPFFTAHGLLEGHVNGRVLGTAEQFVNRGNAFAQFTELPPNYGNAPVPSYASYRKFFTNTKKAGLADYSNKGFFTSDANFGTSKYALPDSIPGNYESILNPAPENPIIMERYLTRGVEDIQGDQTRTSAPIRMTRESVLSELITESGLIPGYGFFSIDRAVIDDQIGLLIPRTVAYSAGILDYYFRGSLTISPTSEGIFGVMDHGASNGFKKLVVKVKNTTPAIANLEVGAGATVPQPMDGGKFVAVVRFHRDLAFTNDLSNAIGLGNCKTLADIYGPGNEPTLANNTFNPNHDPNVTTACRNGEETIVTSAAVNTTLGVNEEKEMSFDFAANPVPVAGVDYVIQIVYRGKLGDEEDAIVSGVKELADPMFITRHNMYDYILQGKSNNNPDSVDLDGPQPITITEPINFFRANTKWKFDYATDFKGMGNSGWSFLGKEAFTAYDYTLPMSYRYTLGPRSNESFAIASAVPPGGFTRIAVLAPLREDTQQQSDSPQIRVERQRVPESAFMGETFSLLPQRHHSKQVGWGDPLRGINGWRNDGYTWHRLENDFSYDVGYQFLYHCSIFPLTPLEGKVVSYAQVIAIDIGKYGTDFFPLEFAVKVTPQNEVFKRRTGRTPYFTPWAQEDNQPAQSCQPPSPVSVNDHIAVNKSFFYYPGIWKSSYSPWDILVSTHSYAVKENPTPADYVVIEENERALSQRQNIRSDGISQTQILQKSPTAVQIAEKYR